MEKVQRWKCGEMVWDPVFALSDVGQVPARPVPSEPQFHCQELEGVAVRSFPVLPFYEVNC